MDNFKEIDVTINDDGTVEFNMKGWHGKECSKGIEDLLSAIGNNRKTTKKVEYYDQQKVKIRRQGEQ